MDAIFVEKDKPSPNEMKHSGTIFRQSITVSYNPTNWLHPEGLGLKKETILTFVSSSPDI